MLLNGRSLDGLEQMSSSLEAWFNTRPLSAPATAIPARPGNVIAVAGSTDGSAELRILSRSDGIFTFEVEAWTNFEDAGGQPHLQWHTFHSEIATFTDSFEKIVEVAHADAKTRCLELKVLELLKNGEAV